MLISRQLEQLKNDLKKAANKEKAKILQRYFKTGEGEYGAGDIFLGLAAAQIDHVTKQYPDLSFKDIEGLLMSPVHEERVTALSILVTQFQKTKENNIQKDIYNFYVTHTARVNNWDLVDMSAGKIMGCYLFDKDPKILSTLAKSKNLWERRIAIIATQYFIKQKRFDETFKIAEILMHDSEDLIHKAVGWMLREIGNRSLADELAFLNTHHKTMPRTMLRYAIEKFPEDLRQAYLAGTPSGKMEHGGE